MLKPTHMPKPNKIRTASGYGETRSLMLCQNSYMNLPRISWMKECQNMETHARVLLMNHLQSRRDKWYPENTVLKLASRRTDISIFAENQYNKGSLQKTHWWSGTSCRKCWWPDNSRSQSSRWKFWISKQSPICSRGARSGNSLISIVSVLNKNFSGNWRELTKVLGGNEEKCGKACEDLSWNHRTSTPHRPETIGTSAVLLQSGLGEKWWAGFHGMLLLSVNNTTCCTHTFFSWSCVIVTSHTSYSIRACVWLKYHEHWSLVQKSSHPPMFHPQSLLFPHGLLWHPFSFVSGPSSGDDVSAISVNVNKPQTHDSARWFDLWLLRQLNRQAAASAASTVPEPSRVCVNSAGEPVHRESEKERGKEAVVVLWVRWQHQFQMLEDQCYGEEETTMKMRHFETSKIFMNSLNDKPKRQFWVSWILRENWLRLNLIRRSKIGREEIQNLRCMSRNVNWNFHDYKCDKMGRANWKRKISLCDELEVRNRLYEENCTRSRQEIEEIRRRCNREEKLTQHGLDEFSVQQETDPGTRSQIMTKIRDVQDNVNFLSDARDSHDPDSGSSSGHSHVPEQHRIISSSRRRRPSCESGAPRSAQDDTSFRGNVFEDPLAQENSKEFFDNSKNFATSMTRKDRTGNCLEKQLTSVSMTPIPIPCFHKRVRSKGHESANYHTVMTGNHTSGFGTYSQNGMMNDPGYKIPENASWQIPRLYKISKLETELQNRRMLES